MKLTDTITEWDFINHSVNGKLKVKELRDKDG